MAKQFSRKVSLNKDDFQRLYANRQALGTKLRKKMGVSIPFEVYFQDPFVAKKDPLFGFDKKCHVDWEPGLADGPTSARFAVVDYNGDTETLAPPAQWDRDKMKFVHGDVVLGEKSKDTLQFHQVNVWAVLQRALGFFEDPNGLGRRIPWGFEGNRLIVVPHAGYGENAYYDRQSKSLQFYYFDGKKGQVFTCLSTDIIHHEFGHAVLDGIRPLLNESASVETAAFHEFIGDLTSILLILRNNEFRARLVQETKGDLTESKRLAGIAEEFGDAVKGRPYLRTAANDLTMDAVKGTTSHHRMSEVLTGAMFDILLRLSKYYQEKEHPRRRRAPTAKEAFWYTIQRMQRVAVQPLDFLPPVDVTFRDYALAVLRAEELANPRDPDGYRGFMIEAFVNRGILGADEVEELTEGGYLHERLNLDIRHDVEQIGASKANAYRFLDDNRDKLGLPVFRDLLVTDLYFAEKYARQARRLPRQLILEYVWREDLRLEGRRFGRFDGVWTTMLCGGTLVFDENGTLLWWAKKADTAARRERFLDEIAQGVATGQIGAALGGERGLLGTHMAPFSERTVDGSLRIELTPHLGVSEEHAEDHRGDRRWEISS